MIINESRLNERSINLGGGKSAYAYGGKYYIKSGNTKKEISANQYKTLLNGRTNDKDLEDYKKSKQFTDEVESKLRKANGDFSKVAHLGNKYQDEIHKQGQLLKNLDDDGDLVHLSGPGTESHLNMKGDETWNSKSKGYNRGKRERAKKSNESLNESAEFNPDQFLSVLSFYNSADEAYMKLYRRGQLPSGARCNRANNSIEVKGYRFKPKQSQVSKNSPKFKYDGEWTYSKM